MKTYVVISYDDLKEILEKHGSGAGAVRIS
jgi:hypothetical protein